MERPNDMFCCGTKIVTPFCPLCGKASPSRLASLLVHVRNNVGAQTKELARQSSSERDHGEATKNTLIKWQEWESGLIDAIAKENNNEQA